MSKKIRHDHNHSLAKVRAVIWGVKYPATERDLLGAARDAAEGDDVVDILKRLPARSYGSLHEALDTLHNLYHSQPEAMPMINKGSSKSRKR